jgi:hypothetical protein
MGGELDDPHTLFFHVRIFVGMVVSFALTYLIRGLVHIVERPHHKPLYWVHLVWVASTFVFLVHFWWWELRFSRYEDWTFHVYLFLILYAVLLSFMSALLLPADLGEHAGYREYFYSRRRWLFAVLALAYLVDFVDTGLKGRAFFESLGNEYLVRNFGYIVASVIAIFTRNVVFHGTFAVIGLLHQIWWVARMYERLN